MSDHKPHDAGSHDQPMTPGVQAAIDAADARGLLPPLPPAHTLSRGDEDGPLQLGYTAKQMRAYAWHARQAIYSAEQAQIEAPLRKLVEDLRHERNVLQRISARRAAALERVGLHADCANEEADVARAGLWWPMLEKPARVGNGTFGVGVSARLVVEAAQRQHEYAQQEERLTDEQARENERNRRRLWDMLNGPVMQTDMKDAIEQAVQAERQACSIAVWMTLQDALADDADDKGLEGWMREAEARVKARA